MPTVWIDVRAVDQMVADIRTWGRRRETGGPLFGYESDRDLVVACAPGVGASAVRHVGGFEPETGRIDELIAQAHTDSHARYRYVGSWHTHPGGRSVPSARDRLTARAIASEPQVDLIAPLMLIARTSRLPLSSHIREISAWRWDPESRDLAHVPNERCVLLERLCPDQPGRSV